MKKDLWDDFYEKFMELGGDNCAGPDLRQLIETHQYFINARKQPPLTEEQEAEAAREYEEFKIAQLKFYENNRNN